jgi:lipid II:glycine glycyltransferase (peptidoglycan interpeptide bridge formation enzyme)
LGNKIWRFGIFHEGEIIAVALSIKISAKRGSFLLVPHGPVVKSNIYKIKFEIVKILKDKLNNLAKQEKVDFIRISPILKRTEENNKLFKDLDFRVGPLHYHPESSWKLNINLNEDQILSQMRKTTRYLIKQSQNNKDIKIVKSTNVKDMEIFYKIHQEVVRTQKFVPFSLDYLSKEFLAFLTDNQISLFFAKYKGNIIAGSFEIFWSGIGFYHHAALLPEFKKLPVSYVLQWEAIKEAKIKNCETYDFWGYADPVKNPKHPYSGPTLFKMGFGGYKEEYVKTQDLIISQKYWLNYIIETIRKIKRGLWQ